MKFRTKELAFTHYQKQGFRYDTAMSIKEDKWFMFRKGRKYAVITPKYDNIVGTSWHVKAWS